MTTTEILVEHWALDETAAGSLASQLNAEEAERLEGFVEPLEEGVKVRDYYRDEIGAIFEGKSSKRLMIIGPCSLDIDVDYTDLFDYIEELQAVHEEDAIIALRGNGAKPRTSGGWTGLFYATSAKERGALESIYLDAFSRGIPIVTEVTQPTELGSLAPYLSGFWLGARDVQSTALRSIASAYHLPVGIKNDPSGSFEVVENTIKAVRKKSGDNDGSGVDLGTIASSSVHPRGISTGVLPVGEGNQQTAIIARGYKLPDAMPSAEKRKAAIAHLSGLCAVGLKTGSAVIVDVSHGVAPMLDVGGKDQDRVVKVLREFHQALRNGELTDSEVLAGIMGEVGVVTGRTDPNHLLTPENRAHLGQLAQITFQLLNSKK